MKHAVLMVCLVVGLANPVAADEGEPSDLNRLFGELMGRIDPYLGQLTELLGDLSGWHAPEVLENGDILIRRRQPLVEPEESPETTPSPDADDAPVLDPLEL
jgi:hypothetical protein